MIKKITNNDTQNIERTKPPVLTKKNIILLIGIGCFRWGELAVLELELQIQTFNDCSAQLPMTQMGQTLLQLGTLHDSNIKPTKYTVKYKYRVVY